MHGQQSRNAQSAVHFVRRDAQFCLFLILFRVLAVSYSHGQIHKTGGREGANKIGGIKLQILLGGGELLSPLVTVE